jgi:protein-tyrosine phosphatase
MPSILFVCTANQFRSPLAAAILNRSIRSDSPPGSWLVESAGTWTEPGQPAASIAVKLANQLGLPGLKEHKTRQVSQQLLDGYDLILVMEKGQLEGIISEFHNLSGRLMLLSKVVDSLPYDIPDPVSQKNDPEEVISELQTLIERGRDKILQLAESIHSARQISNSAGQ